MSALVRQFVRRSNAFPKRFCAAAAASKPKVQVPVVENVSAEKVEKVETASETTGIDPVDGGIKLDATEIVDTKPKRRLRRRREATFGANGSMDVPHPDSELTPEEEAIAEAALMERLQAKAEKCCKQSTSQHNFLLFFL